MVYASLAAVIAAACCCSSMCAAQELQLQQWQPYDLAFQGPRDSRNPFTDVDLSATFTGPDGGSLRVPAYYSGEGVWKVRFSPPSSGMWCYLTSSNVPELNGKRGTLTCIPQRNPRIRGSLRVDPDNPHHFVYEDGERCFLMGFECDWLALIDLDHDGISRAKQLVGLYASHGFNEVIMNVYAHDAPWRRGNTGSHDFGPPALYPWEGTNDAPIHARINTSYFDKLDMVMDYLLSSGVHAHLFFKVYNKMVNWPERRSTADDLFFQYVTARYQAYPNVIWDFSKETYNERDLGYVRDRLALIKRTDAYRRLRTAHDGDAFVNDPASDGILDFYTDQHHEDLYATILSQRDQKNWPVHNAEYGYEWGLGGSEDRTFGSAQPPDEVLLRTYEVVMAGGYPAYYYTNHAWDVVHFAEKPAGLPRYKILSDIVRRARWWSMEPHDELLEEPKGGHCLANPGEEYIIYLSRGGHAIAGLTSSGGELEGVWTNAFTGDSAPAGHLKVGACEVRSPWPGDPSLLHVKRRAAGSTPSRTD